MDTKLKTILFSIIFVNFISAQACNTYKCGELEAPLCSKKAGTEFTLKRCGDNQHCLFEEKDTSSCTGNPSIVSYPGGSCGSDNDCISKKCDQSKCVGKKQNEVCLTQEECLIGLVCRKAEKDKACLAPLTEADTCTEDVECPYTHGCLEGKCTKYFSLEDGSKTKNNLLCKSGYLADGSCLSFTSVNPVDQECTKNEDCKYKTADGKDFKGYEVNCECGKNKDGKKYCHLAPGDKIFKSWVEESVKLLLDTSLCHTAERSDKLGVCNERRKTDKSFAFRKSAQNATNSLEMATNYPSFVNNDSCVKYVVSSAFDDTPVRPDKYQCPKYTCDKSGKSCFTSKNPFNEDGSGVAVTLTAGVCEKNSTCTGIETIFNDETEQGTCKPKTPATIIRFPGEECAETKDCITEGDFKSECVEKKCTGKKETEACLTTTECLVGLFCDETSKTCLKQLAFDAACKSTFECQNDLACYNSKCAKFASLKTGDDVSVTSLGNFAANPNKNSLCEFGQVTIDGGKCASFAYTGTPNKDGFVTCKLGDKCEYTDGAVKFTSDCQCGFNAEGQGYCPSIASATRSTEFKNKVNHTVKKYKNSCHSNSRFNCYAVDKVLADQDPEFNHKAETANLWYNSVKCASDVLSGQWMKISSVVLLMIVGLLI